MPAKLPLRDEVPEEVASRFSLEAVESELLPRGDDSQHWTVRRRGDRVAGGAWLLRCERWWPRPLEPILTNLQTLRERGGAVVAPVNAPGGELVVVHEDRRGTTTGWTLWPKVEAARERPDATAAATLLAKLHDATFQVDDVPAPALIRTAVRERWRDVEALPEGNWFVHMDFHANNILVSPDGYVSIDWIDGGAGALETDLAFAAVYAAVDAMAKDAGNPADPVAIVDAYHAAYQRAGGRGDVEASRQLVGTLARLAALRANLHHSDRAARFEHLARRA
jgi:Ser/Thr protein kinase RdoA (MazF antagonist)